MTVFQNPFDSNAGGMLPDVGSGQIQNITERHVACVLLLDTSGSMQEDDAIGQLRSGIENFKAQVMSNPSSSDQTLACIDIAMIAFGPDVRMIQDFVPLSEMDSCPNLRANGGTPMGGALDMALDVITEQKKRYNQYGTPYFRPWIFCITDGEPNDEYASAARRLKQMEAEKRVIGYCVGVRNYNVNAMAEIFAQNHLLQLDNLNFPALFEFLSSSLVSVSLSDPSRDTGIAVEAPADLKVIKLDI